MKNAKVVEQFQRDGFVNGGKVLDDSTVELLRRELTRVIAEKDRTDVPQPVSLRNLTGNDNRPVWQVLNIWQASEPFRALLSHVAICEMAGDLLPARQLRVWHDQIQYKPAETGGVNMFHQDSPKWRTLTPKTTQLSAWIALDDVDESNGCMSMVAGSHRWGNKIDFLNTLTDFNDLPETFDGQRVDVRLCPVRKGHVHFHHALTWHGSHANTSGRPRRAIAIHYMSEETQYVASGDHAMKSFVEVADGARLEGAFFPLVWER